MNNQFRVAHYNKPKFVQLELTYSCNENCLFCYNPARTNKIDLGKIHRLVDAVRKNNIPHVQLTGGEVSLLGVDVLNDLIDRLAETSVVSIVTNGIRKLEGLSKNLTAIYISLHGMEGMHERLTRRPGGWKKTVESIRYYVGEGFSVTSDTIMTCLNYKEITSIAKFAKSLGMSQVMVNRFEDGGLGSENRNLLRPSLEQFREAITLIIEAMKRYEIPIGFGTATPFCLDRRLIAGNLAGTCDAGIAFAAVSPDGDLRICNQSNRIYGNVMNEPIEGIWNKTDLDDYRCLKWVTEPCRSCPLLHKCRCGCFVDASQPEIYCIDYAVREQAIERERGNEYLELRIPDEKEVAGTYCSYAPTSYPPNYRRFRVDPTACADGDILKVKNSAYRMDDHVQKIWHALAEGDGRETDLLEKYSDSTKEHELRKLLSALVAIEALRLDGFEGQRT